MRDAMHMPLEVILDELNKARWTRPVNSAARAYGREEDHSVRHERLLQDTVELVLSHRDPTGMEHLERLKHSRFHGTPLESWLRLDRNETLKVEFRPAGTWEDRARALRRYAEQTERAMPVEVFSMRLKSLFQLQEDDTAGSNLARLRDLAVRAVLLIFRRSVQQFASEHNVVKSHGYLLLRTRGKPGTSHLALAFKARDDTECLVELLTGLWYSTLLYAIPRLDWRDATLPALRRWADDVAQSEGRLLSNEHLLEHRAALVEFFEEYDEQAQQERREADKQLRLAQDAARAALVRALVPNLDVRRATEWRRQIADIVGVHPPGVKRWLRQFAPDVLKKLYPDKKRPVRRSGS